MTAPRLEIDLDKLHHNALTLVTRLGLRGISVTGVTKAILGAPEIAKVWLRAGVRGLGDSRLANIERMRRGRVSVPMTLIRTPMMSQAAEVVRLTAVSFNTEREVIRRLASAAQRRGVNHGVVIMVELGDLREGVMPDNAMDTAREVLQLPHLSLIGIGTNLACRSGVSPDNTNMAELSALAAQIELTFDIQLSIISGGNSANLQWALQGGDVGRINDLRLGEAMLLGCEPLHRQPIEGLHTDAFTLVAEVIESNAKPSKPWGTMAQSAFGDTGPSPDRGLISQAILAIGRQDIDPDGLVPPPGIEILAASSDHLVVSSSSSMPPLMPGAELAFQLNYSALLRATTSPFISQVQR